MVLAGWAMKLKVVADFFSGQSSLCAAWCAWQGPVNLLTSIFPAQTSVRPNSAVAYILAGLALWFLREGEGRRSLGKGMAKRGADLRRFWSRVGRTDTQASIFSASMQALIICFFTTRKYRSPGCFRAG